MQFECSYDPVRRVGDYVIYTVVRQILVFNVNIVWDLGTHGLQKESETFRNLIILT